jgi:hypothetical protein
MRREFVLASAFMYRLCTARCQALKGATLQAGAQAAARLQRLIYRH